MDENTLFFFDFHDVFVKAKEAWIKSLSQLLSVDEFKLALTDYESGESRHFIAGKYNLSYSEWEHLYRSVLAPIEENIALANEISKRFPVLLLSKASCKRIKEDARACRIDIGNYNIIDKDALRGQSKKEYLQQKAGQYDWVVYITHEVKEFRVEGNVVWIPTIANNQQEVVYGFLPQHSFDEHARNKKLYHELSKYYMLSISNDTTKEVNYIIRAMDRFGIGEGSNVLDCCCGVGRHALALADIGYHVTGLDFSEDQIRTAESNNHSNLCKFQVMDVRDINLPIRNYQTAICMWTTYNYLSEEEELRKFISGVARYQKDGDLFILDAKNIPALDKYRCYLRERRSSDGDTIVNLLITKRVLDHQKQFSNYYYLLKDKQNKYAFHDEEFVRFYNLSELASIIFPWYVITGVYGDFDDTPFSAQSSLRFVVELRRTKERFTHETDITT